MADHQIPQVALIADEGRWDALPLEFQTSVREGVKTVERIRSEIARCAKVATMPLVRARLELWFARELNAFSAGKAGFLTIDGVDHAAVTLPINTVLCGDEATIRAVLVHEFAHCFFLLSHIIEAGDAGQTATTIPVVTGRYGTAEEDRARLVQPSDWFGDADAVAFPYWGDPRSRVPEECIVRLGLHRVVPVIEPSGGHTGCKFAIAADIVAHVRSLRRSARP